VRNLSAGNRADRRRRLWRAHALRGTGASAAGTDAKGDDCAVCPRRSTADQPAGRSAGPRRIVGDVLRFSVHCLAQAGRGTFIDVLLWRKRHKHSANMKAGRLDRRFTRCQSGKRKVVVIRGHICRIGQTAEKIWPQRDGGRNHHEAETGNVFSDVLSSLPCGTRIGRGSVGGDLSGGGDVSFSCT
jgi:hypothetical protein